MHDVYGIRPYEDAYGRPELFPAQGYSAYTARRQQYGKDNFIENQIRFDAN